MFFYVFYVFQRNCDFNVKAVYQMATYPALLSICLWITTRL